MLKLDTHTWVNDSTIEAISPYGSLPLRNLAHAAQDQGLLRDFSGPNGFKSIIFAEDGFVYRCAHRPHFYITRMVVDNWYVAEANRIYLREEYVREIAERLNSSQKRSLAQAKAEGLYVNLSRNKRVRYYVFMRSGRVYGVRSLKPSP